MKRIWGQRSMAQKLREGGRTCKFGGGREKLGRICRGQAEGRPHSRAVCVRLRLFEWTLFIALCSHQLLYQMYTMYIFQPVPLMKFTTFMVFQFSLIQVFGSPELDVPPQEKFNQCSRKMDLPSRLRSLYMQPPVYSAIILLIHFLCSPFSSGNPVCYILQS